MSDYKRLTEKENYDGYVEENCGNCHYYDKNKCSNKDCYEVIKRRLCELEDKIENGTLKDLPCKVGDTIYVPWEYDGEYGVSFHEVTKIEIYKKVIYICFELDTDILSLKYDLYNGGEFLSYWLGERFFLTKPEAENRIKKLKGETK